MSTRKILSSWSKEDCVRFALWCAKKVSHLNDDPRAAHAITSVEVWLKNPNSKNARLAKKSAIAATCAAADKATGELNFDMGVYGSVYAASYAAYAVNAASAKNGDVAYHAHCTATDAAYSINSTDRDLLDIYLSEILIETVQAL